MSAAVNPSRLLAVSGSLRSVSSNRAVLQACASVLPAEAELIFFQGLADLPAFNPDIADADVGPAVCEWRRQLKDCDAVVISTPEYAHGVPGALKNALDWVVGSGEFVDKPCALVSASYRSTYARASLIETLNVMSARLCTAASITLKLESNAVSAAGLLSDAATRNALANAMSELVQSVRQTAAPVG